MPDNFDEKVRKAISKKKRIDEIPFRKYFFEAIDKTPFDLMLICRYLITFKEKKYCDLLKKALYKYDDLPGVTDAIISALGELNCYECYDKIKEIAYSERKAPIINFAAKWALKRLEGDTKC